MESKILESLIGNYVNIDVVEVTDTIDGMKVTKIILCHFHIDPDFPEHQYPPGEAPIEKWIQTVCDYYDRVNQRWVH